MNAISGRATRYLAAASSGLLLAGAFPPLDQGLLAWVALVPLLWSVQSTSPGTAFRLGYLTGLIWFGVVLSWIIPFGLPAWAALIAVQALYVGGFAALLRWLSEQHPKWKLLLIPLVWSAVEVVRSTGPLGFPWALLGVSQHRLLPVLQLASLGGVHLVSLMVVLGNALVFTLLSGPRELNRRGLPVVAALLLAVGIGFGLWRMQTPLTPGIRVAALQPNVPPLQKGVPETYEAQLRLMRQLTQGARAQGADLIVFPETAIPLNLLGPEGLAREVGSWAPDRVVVASSLEVDSRREGVRNSAVVIHGHRVLGIYTKRRLVPFGEVGITPGDQADPIVTPVGTVGIAISYESAFAEIGRSAAQQGAGIQLVLTNDGWFGVTAGP
ncbi:MAG: apolipoprotein N-acyltransferase, partial [bacterium]